MYEKNFNIPVNENKPFPVTLGSQLQCAPFEEYLEMNIEDAAPGTTRLTMPFKVKHAQSRGYMHGGAIVSLAHSALALAVKKQLPPDCDIQILTFSVRFMRPITGGTVTAVARITEDRESDISGEVVIADSNGEKVANFGAAYRKARVIKKN